MIKSDDRKQWLTVRQAAEAVPGQVHVYTIARWIRDGVVVRREGRRQVIRLAARKVGGRFFVASDDLAEFIEQTTAATIGVPDVGLAMGQRVRMGTAAVALRDREARAKNALAELSALGVPL